MSCYYDNLVGIYKMKCEICGKEREEKEDIVRLIEYQEFGTDKQTDTHKSCYDKSIMEEVAKKVEKLKHYATSYTKTEYNSAIRDILKVIRGTEVSPQPTPEKPEETTNDVDFAKMAMYVFVKLKSDKGVVWHNIPFSVAEKLRERGLLMDTEPEQEQEYREDYDPETRITTVTKIEQEQEVEEKEEVEMSDEAGKAFIKLFDIVEIEKLYNKDVPEKYNPMDIVVKLNEVIGVVNRLAKEIKLKREKGV